MGPLGGEWKAALDAGNFAAAPKKATNAYLRFHIDKFATIVAVTPEDQDITFLKEAPREPSPVPDRNPLGVDRGGSSVAFDCPWATGQDDDSEEEAEQRWERSNRHRVNSTLWEDEYHRLAEKVKKSNKDTVDMRLRFAGEAIAVL